MNTWWDAVVETVRTDFSDLPDPAAVTRLVIRLLMAATLGGVLGFEREWRGKDAGLRTHILVALGAALFVFIPQQMGMPDADMSRVIQGIATGIGFVGAGAILKLESERRIEGLTTAAGIWLTAAVGVAAGMGRSGSALVATVLALIVFAPLQFFDRPRGDPSNDPPKQ